MSGRKDSFNRLPDWKDPRPPSPHPNTHGLKTEAYEQLRFYFSVKMRGKRTSLGNNIILIKVIRCLERLRSDFTCKMNLCWRDAGFILNSSKHFLFHTPPQTVRYTCCLSRIQNVTSTELSLPWHIINTFWKMSFRVILLKVRPTDKHQL